jgi:hypothetical protein
MNDPDRRPRNERLAEYLGTSASIRSNNAWGESRVLTAVATGAAPPPQLDSAGMIASAADPFIAAVYCPHRNLRAVFPCSRRRLRRACRGRRTSAGLMHRGVPIVERDPTRARVVP